MHGRVTNGSFGNVNPSNTPMTLTFPVPASIIVWSHNRMALHFGGGTIPRRFAFFFGMSQPWQ